MTSGLGAYHNHHEYHDDASVGYRLNGDINFNTLKMIDVNYAYHYFMIGGGDTYARTQQSNSYGSTSMDRKKILEDVHGIYGTLEYRNA